MPSRIAVSSLIFALYLQVETVAFPFRTIVLSGDSAPGTPPGIVFTGFNSALVNEDGAVVFNAFVGGPGVVHTHPSNAYGIWKHDAGILTKVVRSGEQAEGLPAGVNYYLPGVYGIDGQGRVAFSAEAPGASSHGIFSAGQGTLRLVARESNQVPGQPAGVTFQLFSLVPLMNDAGEIAFTSFIQGPGIPSFTEGLFSDRSGSLELVVKEGDAAPGIPGASIRQIGARPVFNDFGVIAFSGRYTGGVFPNDNAVWTEQAGAFTMLAVSGQAAPGMAPGIVFGEINEPRINNAGQVMFHSNLTGPGISSADAAIWLHDSGNLRLIVREGTSADVIGLGINHGSFGYAYLNGVGQATFTGGLTGADVNAQNDTALWSWESDALTLIAREGDHAPGTPTGVLFGDLSRLGGSPGFQVNNNGQVAFQATLTGPGITTANDTGIWATDHTGTLRLVAREGDLFDVNDDPQVEDWRTISLTNLQWYSGGGEDGYGKALNNSGELTIALSFTDFSQGVFVISTVPEPSTMLLFAIASLCLLICQRRDTERQSRRQIHTNS